MLLYLSLLLNIMKIGHIELFVKDTIASKNFFCDVLGFELSADQGHNQWVKLGEMEILLRSGKNLIKTSTYQDSDSGIVLYTDNLDDTATELKNKGLKFKGTDGSPNCLTFTDLDGHWFQLVNPDHE